MSELTTRRPEFITEADIARWDEHIKNDVELQKVLTENQFENFQEVLRASRWLVEEMTSRGISEFEIGAMQQTLGAHSFGADPWQVAMSIRDVYIHILATEKT
jgi:hypothetical protein